MFKRDHKKVITIMRMRCRKHICKLIENCINAIETYKILKKTSLLKTLISLTTRFINFLTFD